MKTILTALALSAGVPELAANNPSLNVNVSNTPLPVSVTNETSWKTALRTVSTCARACVASHQETGRLLRSDPGASGGAAVRCA